MGFECYMKNNSSRNKATNRILKEIREYINSITIEVDKPIQDNKTQEDTSNVIEEYSIYVKRHRSANIKMLKKCIAKNLLRVDGDDIIDPLSLRYNFISFSDYDFGETRWTQWLCNCLKDKYVGEIFWKALCKAVDHNFEMNKTQSNKNEKTRHIGNWLEISGKRHHKTNEYIAEYPIKSKDIKNRRMDIYINNKCYKYKISIENKIGAEQSKDQLEDYKTALKNRCKKLEECGLIYLTENLREDKLPSGYINIDYETFAIMLRRELKIRLARAAGKYKVSMIIKLSPVFQTIKSIEEDVLNYNVSLTNLSDTVDMVTLEEINAYLKKGG